MKKFYTAADVNFYASKGESVIYIQPEDVVTSVAREEAEKKGIQFSISGIVEPASSCQISKVLPSQVPKEMGNHILQRSVCQPDNYYVKVKDLPYKNLLSNAEVEQWREEFPILKDVVHLGNCSQSAQSKRVLAGIQRYLDNWGSIGMDWDSWMEEIDLAKAEFAKLINAKPEEIAIASSVSDLVTSIANSLDYTGKRKKIVVTDMEFPTVDYVWLANQRHGAKVDFISVNENHQIELSEYERYIDENTLLTSITQVYYLNGFKQDVRKIADIAHRKGSLILVDAYQCLGTEPMDVKEMKIDVLVSGCLKYLFGIPGVAFMYVNPELIQNLKPSVTGWFGQTNPFLFQTRYLDWANMTSRFDTGTPPVLNAYAVRAGLEIVNEVTVPKIKDRIDMLSARALNGVIKRGLKTISPFDVSKKGGTTAIVCGDKVDSHTMEKLLREKNVIGSGRGEVIRIAPHFYTKPEEIDYALDRIKEILDGR